MTLRINYGVSYNVMTVGPNAVPCAQPLPQEWSTNVPQNVIDQLLASHTIPTAAAPSIQFVSEPQSLPIPIQLRPNYMASTNNARCALPVLFLLTMY